MKVSWWITFTGKKSYKYLEIVLLSIVKDYFFPCFPGQVLSSMGAKHCWCSKDYKTDPHITQQTLSTSGITSDSLFLWDAVMNQKAINCSNLYNLPLLCCKKCIQIRLFKHFFAQSSIVSINYIALAELILHQLNTFMLLWQCPQSILAWSFHCRQGVWALLAFLRVHCAVDGFCDTLWNTSLCLKKRWLQWPLADLSPFLECYSASLAWMKHRRTQYLSFISQEIELLHEKAEKFLGSLISQSLLRFWSF